MNYIQQPQTIDKLQKYISAEITGVYRDFVTIVFGAVSAENTGKGEFF